VAARNSKHLRNGRVRTNLIERKPDSAREQKRVDRHRRRISIGISQIHSTHTHTQTRTYTHSGHRGQKYSYCNRQKTCLLHLRRTPTSSKLSNSERRRCVHHRSQNTKESARKRKSKTRREFAIQAFYNHTQHILSLAVTPAWHLDLSGYARPWKSSSHEGGICDEGSCDALCCAVHWLEAT